MEKLVVDKQSQIHLLHLFTKAFKFYGHIQKGPVYLVLSFLQVKLQKNVFSAF